MRVATAMHYLSLTVPKNTAKRFIKKQQTTTRVLKPEQVTATWKSFLTLTLEKMLLLQVSVTFQAKYNVRSTPASNAVNKYLSEDDMCIPQLIPTYMVVKKGIGHKGELR